MAETAKLQAELKAERERLEKVEAEVLRYGGYSSSPFVHVRSRKLILFRREKTLRLSPLPESMPPLNFVTGWKRRLCLRGKMARTT
jgi:hypothetical protein